MTRRRAAHVVGRRLLLLGFGSGGTEVAAAFLSRLLRRDPTPAETADLVKTYLREWNTGVVYPPGTPQIIDSLADRFQLAIVTNTHHG